MDEQPSTFPTWLTIDLAVIAVSAVIIGIWIAETRSLTRTLIAHLADRPLR
jgi:hypothetical protein